MEKYFPLIRRPIKKTRFHFNISADFEKSAIRVKNQTYPSGRAGLVG